MADAVHLAAIERLGRGGPLRKSVHQQLEGLITRGVLRPGARLVEIELAQQIGVSRGPVREALQMLAIDGFVDLRPHEGAHVHVPTAREVDDFFDVRRALDGEAAVLAAERIDDDSAKHLRTVVDLGFDLVRHGDDPSQEPRRAAFHREVTKIADNPLLTKMLSPLEKRSVWYLSPFEQRRRIQTWEEHSAIADAIVARDSRQARILTTMHVEGARAHYKLVSRPH